MHLKLTVPSAGLNKLRSQCSHFPASKHPGTGGRRGWSTLFLRLLRGGGLLVLASIGFLARLWPTTLPPFGARFYRSPPIRAAPSSEYFPSRLPYCPFARNEGCGSVAFSFLGPFDHPRRHPKWPSSSISLSLLPQSVRRSAIFCHRLLNI